MTKQERAALVPELKAKINAFSDEDFGLEFTEVFDDPNRHYAPPDFKPSSKSHPRVLINKDMLDGIRSAFRNPECAAAVAEYERLRDSDTDGALPPPFEHETGRRGNYNYDYTVLAAIEARALEYLISGEEYYGYSALLGMLNFLKTMEINWIHSDQCREYGMAMYFTALVYDWCYDLATEADRRRLAYGVENKLCRGKSGMPQFATCGGVKLEVGFPPFGQGCVSGHGTEMQLLRDFLAFSIAIYDEFPGWWNYVGARLENEYIPVREVFYASGMYPQGMSCYAPYRFVGDLWSACIFRALLGKNPFPEADMKRVVRSFLANETVDGKMFTSGDGTGARFFNVVGYCALLSAFLFDDKTARAAALFLKHGITEFTYGYVNISPTFALIASSRGIRAASDRREDIPLIHKNRGFFNQYISRSGWDSDATVVLTKAGGRNTSNHEHCDAGHFQVWHKGYLTSHAGTYRGYGSDNHYYYHIASIGHNVPLVFNPAYSAAEPVYNENGVMVNKAAYWYCGGQDRLGESVNLNDWHNERYIAGEAPIMQSKMDAGKSAYAYVSTEITRAYSPETVSYLKRSMLTSYKTDGSVPMTLFVFDRIESVDPSFKKTDIMQVISSEEPKIDGKTAITENGDGQLAITAITDDTVTAVGGPGRNYLVNGRQCNCPGDPIATWGRIEISPNGESKIDHILFVITVGDRGATLPKPERLVCSKSCEGAYLAGNAAIFRKSREDLGADIDFTLPADAYTYFSGLNEGDFAVIDENGKIATVISVGDSQNLATAELKMGSYTLKKI